MYSNWLNQQTNTAHRVDTACGFASLVSLSALKSAQSDVTAGVAYATLNVIPVIDQPRNRGGFAARRTA